VRAFLGGCRFRLVQAPRRALAIHLALTPQAPASGSDFGHSDDMDDQRAGCRGGVSGDTVKNSIFLSLIRCSNEEKYSSIISN